VVNKGKTALGMVAIQDVTREAAAPIFSAKENYVTTPVMSAFRWHIYRVGKIVQPRMDTFDEARPIISRDIASRQAQETLSKLMTGFEDTMAGGVTFEQAAEKIGQKIHKAESINRDGTTVDGKKMDLPAYDNFLPTAFATQEKDHSQAVQAADGSYFMVRVDGVAPEHVRPLAEVKAQAVQGALARKVKEHLEKTAQGLSEQLRAKKKTPAEILAASGLAIKFVAAGNIKRASEMVEQGELKDKPLPHGLIGELFRINPQETTHSYVTADGSYAIATLAQVTPAPATPDPKVLDAIRDDLKGTLTREVLHSFMDSLRKKNTITIDGTRLGLNKGETSSE
jgi:peptidyl-prolyl cis-trans isomerase D